MRTLLPLLMALVPTVSEARDRGDRGDGADGMLMPDLSRVLGDGWDVPPELSDRALPGSVLEVSESELKVVMSGCIGVTPNENTLTDVSMSNTLSGGVGWGGGGLAASGSGAHMLKLSFQGPTVVNFELIDFVPATSCVDKLSAFARRGGDMSRLVVVQEAIMARVSGCENSSASVGVGLPAAGGTVASGGACQMFSDAPVVVGFKVVPFADIPELAGLAGASKPTAPSAAASPAPGKSGRSKPDKAPPKDKRAGTSGGKADSGKKVKPKHAIEALRPRAKRVRVRVPDGPYKQEDVDTLEQRITRQEGFAARVAPLTDDAAILGLSVPEHPMKEDQVVAVEDAVGKARAATKYTLLTADFRAFCALQPTGELRCWDDGDDTPVTSTPPGVRFQKVSLGMAVGCGLTLDHQLRCWGEPYNAGVDRPPSGTWSEFSFNDNGGCAINSAGRMKCWGGDHFNYRQYKAKTVPPGTWTAVISGDYHNCGIRSDGVTVCWGNRNGGGKGAPYTVDADLVRFTDAGDGGRTCGIDREGHGVCWPGPDRMMRTKEQFRSIKYDWVKTSDGSWAPAGCGVRADGSLGCVTADGSPRSHTYGPVPDGRFVQVASTHDMTCVQDELGQVRCWKFDRR